MSIKDLGYLDFLGTKCIYIQDEMNYILMPTDRESNIQSHYQDENYLLPFSDEMNRHSIACVKKQIGSGINHICLELNYIFKSFSDEAIDGFVMRGNEIDEFFSPLEYYYHQKRRDEYTPKDLLYGQDSICHYQFEYCGKAIDVELVFGNILREGIRTDLTLHPQLVVTFESTHDTNFVYNVSSVIIKFLQFVHRKKTYNINSFELFHKTEKGISHIGYMFSSLYDKNCRAKSKAEASFLVYKEKLSNILNIIAAEEAFPLSHLGKSIEHSFEYTPERLGAISAAFEYEYKKSKIYPQTNEIAYSTAKESILDFIDKLPNDSPETRIFQEQAKNSIAKLGTQLGLKAKILHAYQLNASALSSSLDFLLGRLKSIDKVASSFPSLRGKVLHNEMGYVFNDEERDCIRFVEILQFVMVLKRSKYSDKEIEIILGALYYCNNAFMDQL